ncbi:MAG TPA: hypothetical protein VM123_12945 [archaeon]|nr:hypothetical protein [archaeon]
MVVPVSGNLNFLPVEIGKKNYKKESEKVSFEEYLVERIEPFEEGAGLGKENEQPAKRGEKNNSEENLSAGEKTDTGSHGGGEENSESLRGRRIDLRA